MLKQRTPMQRKPFRRKPPARVTLPLDDDLVVTIERIAPRMYRVPAPSAPVFASTPKFPYVRNAKLIEAYRLIPCQFEGCGFWAPQTIVGCHSNWAVHGKCTRKKASDDRCASGCPRCHRELDQGKIWSEGERRRKWWTAHVNTIRRLVAANYWPSTVAIPDTSTYPKEWQSECVRRGHPEVCEADPNVGCCYWRESKETA